jgi:hypothetical protein
MPVSFPRHSTKKHLGFQIEKISLRNGINPLQHTLYISIKLQRNSPQKQSPPVVLRLFHSCMPFTVIL